jgi:RND family efflux transporter MFP subunit
MKQVTPMPPHDHELPDEISRTENEPVSTQFDADTGRRVKRGAAIAGGILLVGFLVVAVIRFFDARALAAGKETQYSLAPGVDVVVARSAKQGQELVLPGQTAAWFETTIYARVNGYVAKWSADIGDRVSKGEVLATIETPELDAELAASKAQLQASQAQSVARQAEAEFGKTTNERWRDSPKGVVSDQEREAKYADYKSAQARLYAAEAQVALDKSRVDQYRTLAEFKQVKAPFDGTITERKIDVGNLVTAGSASTTTPLYRISQTDSLRVFVDVPQASAGELMSAGVPAQIRASGSVAGTFAGKIARTSEAVNPQARTMRVEVDMPNTNHALLPGMYVNVAFALRPRGLVEVPAAALVFRAQGAQVAVVDQSGKIRYNDAVIARDNGALVELASGAQPGDRLVLNISSQIQPGQPVTVNNTGEAR